jgi:uncharacterized protein YfkK (UPF0435 family)
MASEILLGLEKLLKESKELDKRFTELNKGFLYPEEIEEQNRIRIEKLEKIYDIVVNANK